jgi:hypothetical protein
MRVRAIGVAILISSAAMADERDNDLACAVASMAELAEANLHGQDSNPYFTIASFYIGRLSARDDTTYWSAVIKGRIAELKKASRSPVLFSKCMDFFTSKLK